MPATSSITASASSGVAVSSRALPSSGVAVSTEASRDLVGGEKDKSAGSARLLTDESELTLIVMEDIARKRGYILPGKRIDYERTARALLDDFRSGKIGRITLELPETRT